MSAAGASNLLMMQVGAEEEEDDGAAGELIPQCLSSSGSAIEFPAVCSKSSLVVDPTIARGGPASSAALSNVAPQEYALELVGIRAHPGAGW